MKNTLLASLLLASTVSFAGPPRKLTPAPTPTATRDHKAHGADCATAEKRSDGACLHPENAKAAAATSESDVVVRGAKLSGAQTVALAELMKNPAQYAGKTVAISDATVRRACEKKGCWMELASAQADKGPGVRVTFKDYAFFVPLDSAGRKAKVEGTVKLASLSEETAKHYESEGATVPRGADGKPSEIQLEATGVELRK